MPINTNSRLDLLLGPDTSHLTFVRQQRRLPDLPVYHPSRGRASLTASIARQAIVDWLHREGFLRQVFQVEQAGRG